MNYKFAWANGAIFIVVVFGALIIALNDKQFYCWSMCLQPEIACLTTVSYTFGLVPATTLAASSAISGCLAMFDICELSCAKNSGIEPYSLMTNISNKCEIYRNGTKIHPYQIKYNEKLANPFNLDANCNALPEPKFEPYPFHPPYASNNKPAHNPDSIPGKWHTLPHASNNKPANQPTSRPGDWISVSK